MPNVSSKSNSTERAQNWRVYNSFRWKPATGWVAHAHAYTHTNARLMTLQNKAFLLFVKRRTKRGKNDAKRMRESKRMEKRESTRSRRVANINIFNTMKRSSKLFHMCHETEADDEWKNKSTRFSFDFLFSVWFFVWLDLFGLFLHFTCQWNVVCPSHRIGDASAEIAFDRYDSTGLNSSFPLSNNRLSEERRDSFARSTRRVTQMIKNKVYVIGCPSSAYLSRKLRNDNEKERRENDEEEKKKKNIN